MLKNHPMYLGLFALLVANTGWTKGGESHPSTSAGVIEKQIQEEFELGGLPPDRSIPLLEIDIPEEQFDIPEGASAYIERICLEGNTVLPQKIISEALCPYLKKELKGKDVIALCKELECQYAKKGYILAWVYPPVQVIENATLHLKVLEGFLGDIEVTGNTHYKSSYIKRYFSDLIGKPLNYNDLMKALLLANENFKCSVEGVLKKGKEVGFVDLVIRVQDEAPRQMNVGYNNWGSDTTTYNQLTSQATFGNVFMNGDILTVMTAMGVPAVMYYINPTYSIPLNGKGTRCTLSYLFTHSDIQVYKPLELTCWSEVGGATFTHPIARSISFECDVFTAFNAKQYKNFAFERTLSYDRLRVLSVGTFLSYFDFMRGRTLANGSFNAGIPYIFNGSAPIDSQSSREGAGGRYFIFNMGLQRVQLIPFGDISFLFTSEAQGTFNKLPLGEQFTIGGMGTVRGYPSSIASGDNGYFLNAEWFIPMPFNKDKTSKLSKKKWKDTLQLLAFLDHGGVYNNSPVPSEDSPAYLTSIGAGLRFYGRRNLNIGFDAAFPLTNQYKQFNSFLYIRVTMDLF